MKLNALVFAASTMTIMFSVSASAASYTVEGVAAGAAFRAITPMYYEAHGNSSTSGSDGGSEVTIDRFLCQNEQSCEIYMNAGFQKLNQTKSTQLTSKLVTSNFAWNSYYRVTCSTRYTGSGNVFACSMQQLAGLNSL